MPNQILDVHRRDYGFALEDYRPIANKLRDGVLRGVHETRELSAVIGFRTLICKSKTTWTFVRVR
ncbi:MAG: hypothetical protein K2N06_06615 [Oscillospiraceae bacterium]|nr:hypothetical protein [Oscillospiraceae bacterium]